MLLAIQWGKVCGNVNRVIREDMIDQFRKDGYTIYNADYRPGLYITKRQFESHPKNTKIKGGK